MNTTETHAHDEINQDCRLNQPSNPNAFSWGCTCQWSEQDAESLSRVTD